LRGYNEFIKIINNSWIICHGAGNNACSMLNNEEFLVYRKKILFFVDGDEQKLGCYIGSGKDKYEIKSISEVLPSNEVVVVITVSDYKTIGEYYDSKDITWFSWVEMAREMVFSHFPKEIPSPRFFVLNTPDYINLGDHAITLGQKKFLSKYNREIYEVGSSICDEKTLIRLKEYICPDDVIFIQGGGNMGSLWKTCEDNIRRIINIFTENVIIVFPQSIYYENECDGGEYFKVGQKTYNSHRKLHICLRDVNSYKFVKENYTCKSLLVPDMVLLLNEKKESKREDVGILFREDKERAISTDYVNTVKNAVAQNGMRIKEISHHSKDLLGTRYERLEKVLEIYRSSKLIITDRLHGMVFSAITGTPCIAFDNSYAKISSLYETWLKDKVNIVIAKELPGFELTKLISKMIEKDNYKELNLSDKYEGLNKLIKSIIKENNYV